MTLNSSPIVYVVSDAIGQCQCIAMLAETSAIDTRALDCVELLNYPLEKCHPACLIMELTLNSRCSVSQLESLCATAPTIPVLVCERNGNVPTAVSAIKAGAFDYFIRPCAGLLACVGAAIVESDRRLLEHRTIEDATTRLNSLTHRQRQVLDFVLQGLSNKQIARVLTIATKTVEVHRSHVMRIMGVKHVAELTRLVMHAQDRRN